VNEPDQIAWDSVLSGNLGEQLAGYEEPADLDDRAAGPGAGLVSLGFLWAALRRTARRWCTLAVLGLIIGAGYYVVSPPTPTATTSLLLVDNPSQNPVNEVQTDLALARSIQVATAVVRQLGLPQTPESFLGSYSALTTSPQVVTISARGATSGEAVQITQAIAQQFLAVRGAYQQTQYNLLQTQLNQELAAAGQQVAAASTNTGQATALTNLGAVQGYVTPTLAAAKTNMQAMIKGSVVLNAAQPVKASRPKGILEYAAAGLVIGLALGVGIIAIAAITSDKLRRRDDIAYAIGAPVRLNVGRLRAGRTLASLRRSRGDMGRVVDHLRKVIPAGGRGPVSLAVVPVDDTASAARAVVALAASLAGSKRVVVADLSAGAPVARLLGVRKPGLVKVDHDDAHLTVMMPAADDVAPVGPLQGLDQNVEPDAALASACAQADIVLSLVSLDPACGGDHLATWATDVVALVTAGRSTATRIHTVGEMIRLSGARLASVVVMDFDKADESLGARAEYIDTTTGWPQLFPAMKRFPFLSQYSRGTVSS
jgi:capsular polysaccharide biosynthesis protein